MILQIEVWYSSAIYETLCFNHAMEQASVGYQIKTYTSTRNIENESEKPRICELCKEKDERS